METEFSEKQSSKTTICPQCGTEIPVYLGYATWCDECGWNIDPRSARYTFNKKDIFQILFRSKGSIYSKKFFEEICESLEKNMNYISAKFIMYLLAFIIRVIPIFLIIESLLLFIQHTNIASFAILLAAVVLPYTFKPEKNNYKGSMNTRAQWPQFFLLVDKITEELKAPKIDGIVFNGDYNAGFAKNAKGKNVLFIGVPLFSILSLEEKVAIIAHEIAHNVNNDYTRSNFICDTMNRLGITYWIITPHKRALFLNILFLPLTIPRFIISKLLYYIWYGLGMLQWKDQQRGEYLADYLASSVSGTKAMLAVLRKLYYEPSFSITLESVSRYKYSKELFSEFKKKIRNVPDREIKRISMLQDSYASRIDATHPPTAYRIQFLKKYYIPDSKISFTQAETEKIEREMEEIEKRFEKILLNP